MSFSKRNKIGLAAFSLGALLAVGACPDRMVDYVPPVRTSEVIPEPRVRPYSPHLVTPPLDDVSDDLSDYSKRETEGSLAPTSSMDQEAANVNIVTDELVRDIFSRIQSRDGDYSKFHIAQTGEIVKYVFDHPEFSQYLGTHNGKNELTKGREYSGVFLGAVSSYFTAEAIVLGEGYELPTGVQLEDVLDELAHGFAYKADHFGLHHWAAEAKGNETELEYIGFLHKLLLGIGLNDKPHNATNTPREGLENVYDHLAQAGYEY